MSIHVRTQRVSPRGVAGPAGVRSNPGQFGALEGMALAQMGERIQRAGAGLEQILDRQRLKDESARLLEAEAARDQELIAFDSEYRERHQGEAALNAPADYQAFVREVNARHRQRLSDPRVLEAYDRSALQVQTRTPGAATGYRDQQRAAWHTDEVNAEQSRALQAIGNVGLSPAEKQAAWAEYEAKRDFLYPGPKELRVEQDNLARRSAYQADLGGRLLVEAANNPQAALKAVGLGGGKGSGKFTAEQWGQLEGISPELQEWFGPEEFLKLRGQVQAAAKSALDVQQGKALSAQFAAMLDQTEGLPLDERKLRLGEMIAEVQDPETRKKLHGRADEEFKRRQQLQDANDAVLGRKYRDLAKAQGWTPAQALAGVDELQGVTDEGRGKLRASLHQEAQRPTRENKAAFNELRRQIDLGRLADDIEIDAYVFENGLTDSQRDAAIKYRDEGGNAGRVSISKTETAYKRLSKSKKVPEDLYDLVIENLPPGKLITDAELRKVIADLVMDGESVGQGSFGYGLLNFAYDPDESYAEAQRNRREQAWLPNQGDIPESALEEIQSLFASRGVQATPERISQFYKEEYMSRPRGSR